MEISFESLGIQAPHIMAKGQSDKTAAPMLSPWLSNLTRKV
jgi:hypothetical protein